jgi:hypothetical protein
MADNYGPPPVQGPEYERLAASSGSGTVERGRARCRTASCDQPIVALLSAGCAGLRKRDRSLRCPLRLLPALGRRAEDGRSVQVAKKSMRLRPSTDPACQ